jgi:hypothetical protein
MKPEYFASSLACLLGVFSSLAAHAQVTVDFDPSGELEAHFPGGPAYAENATGGLNSSVGVNLANLAPDTLSGSQAESLAINGFANGAKFTVGMYFKLSAFGNSVVNSQGTQFLRLGLTNGAGDNFANMPFSTIDLTNLSTGAARFLIRDGGNTVVAAPGFSAGSGGALTGVTFDLDLSQWYYFETTFTRPGDTTTTAVDYAMSVWTASSTGALGTEIASANVAGSTAGHAGTTELNKAAFAGFKASGATTGVLDNFYGSNAGLSQLPVADFRIVSYSRDSGTGESTIVFSSESGADYSLLGGEDLTGLAPVILSIPGTGDDVTVNHTPAGSLPKFFYRVRRN